MLTVRTTFSGVGSPEMALKALGIDYRLVDFCEIDKFAVMSYCSIHGADPKLNLGDIKKVDESKLEPVDLHVWGFPCQDLSVAGAMRGFVDENGHQTRSGLVFDALRIIQATKPKYSVCENVKALTSKKFAKEFKGLLAELEFYGYNNYVKVLNAKEIGYPCPIPQNRERVFIVSIRKDIDDGHFEFPKAQPLTARLKDYLEAEVDEKYYLDEEKTKKLIFNTKHQDLTEDCYSFPVKFLGRNQKNLPSEYAMCVDVSQTNGVAIKTDEVMCYNTMDKDGKEPPQQDRIYNTEGVMTTLSSQLGGRYNVAVPIKTANSTGYDVATDGDSVNLMFPDSKTRRGRVQHQVAGTLETACNQGVIEQIGMLDIRGSEQVRRVYSADGISPTLNTMQGGHRQPKIVEVAKINENRHSSAENSILSAEGICSTIDTMGGGNRQPKILAMRGRYNEDGTTSQQLESREDGCTNTITTVQKDNLVKIIDTRQHIDSRVGKGARVYEDFCPSLTSTDYKEPKKVDDGFRIRKLTPCECWSLMGFSREDFLKAQAVNSNTQLYKQCGNSIVKNVLMAIFKNLLR